MVTEDHTVQIPYTKQNDEVIYTNPAVQVKVQKEMFASMLYLQRTYSHNPLLLMKSKSKVTRGRNRVSGNRGNVPVMTHDILTAQTKSFVYITNMNLKQQ